MKKVPQPQGNICAQPQLNGFDLLPISIQYPIPGFIFDHKFNINQSFQTMIRLITLFMRVR